MRSILFGFFQIIVKFLFVPGTNPVRMQYYSQPVPADYQFSSVDNGQIYQNVSYTLPTQNRFAPMNEWVGMSMDLDVNNSQMECEMTQGKRRRCNTGTQDTFSAMSVDDKLLNMFHKLENLEQTTKSIENIARGMNETKAHVDFLLKRTHSYEHCLKVLAYKSIDLEARSRRRNLIFHGLPEDKNENENCYEILRDFLWKEMCIDLDEYYIERVHRLGSLYKARQRNPGQTPKRPIIAAFSQFSNTETIIETAYMLRGTNYSVTRDYPAEIVSARRNLMPLFREHRQNRNNKVSLEFPARLVVNGKTVADSFPDWYTILQTDRYAMVQSLQNQTQQQNVYESSSSHIQTNNSQTPAYDCSGAPPPRTLPSVRTDNIQTERESTQDRPRTYAQVVSSHPQVASSIQQPNVYSGSQVQSTAPYNRAMLTSAPRNVPRYTNLSVGDQTRIQSFTANNCATDNSFRSGQVDNETVNTSGGQPSYTHL